MSRLEPIVGLPSKKSKTSRSNNRAKCKNKCEICKTIFKSVDDNKNMENKIRGQDATKVARCVNIVIPARGSVEDVTFLCPQHGSE